MCDRKSYMTALTVHACTRETMFVCKNSTVSGENFLVSGETLIMSNGWVDQPNYRGTLNIIWSCLLVILTSTWTVLHVNLPAQTDIWFTT